MKYHVAAFASVLILLSFLLSNTTFAVTLASLPIVAVQVAAEKALEAKEKKGGNFSKVSPDPEV